MCSPLLILTKARARDATPDNKFVFLVSTTKNIISKNFVLVSITVSTSPNISKGGGEGGRGERRSSFSFLFQRVL